MTVKNETFTDRVKAGRALVFLVAAIKPFESSKTIGSIAGFPISIERFDERATLLIYGKHNHRANVSENPAGTIASLEHALESFEDRLRERETDLAKSFKQSADLAKQLDQPFEHEEKFVVATKRLQEIVNTLDITKNEAPPNAGDATELAETAREAPAKCEVKARTAAAIAM